MAFSPDPEAREYRKKEAFDNAEGEIGPGDVMCAAINIYQDEYGLMFEDKAEDDLWDDAWSFYLKHQDQAKDHSDLVDKIVHDLHGGRPTLPELLAQESDHGTQPTKGDF